ncbi:MAG: LuxR C-terminal-related transcriptional regulator, partial [Gammaproteobacteria bacterium]
GYRNKSVARALLISEETVKMHVKNTMAKLGANDRTHAVTIAIQRRYIGLTFVGSSVSKSSPSPKE